VRFVEWGRLAAGWPPRVSEGVMKDKTDEKKVEKVELPKAPEPVKVPNAMGL
jgi:hypothetical protein